MPREPWGAGPGPINRASRRMGETGNAGCGWIVLLALVFLGYGFIDAIINSL